MTTSLKLKIGLLAALILFSFMVLLPTLSSGVPEWWKKYLSPGGIKLGLDLQGGMHLVLRVDLDKALENSLELAATDLKDVLREQKILAVRTGAAGGGITFTLPNSAATDTVKQVVSKDFPNLDLAVTSEQGQFPRFTIRLKSKEVDFIRQHAVNQSLEIIRNRIDQFGVAEPVIIRQGANEIVVQLPGVKDRKRAMGLIGQTAQLEFKLVFDEGGIDPVALIAEAVQAGRLKPDADRRQINLALQNQLPQGTEVAFEKRKDAKTGQERKTPLLLKSQVLMTGEMVKNAQVRVGGNFNEPYVGLDLTGRGGKLFGAITEKNVGKRLAIVLDGTVRSAPVIRERILGGSAQITGDFTHEEATDLAIVLRVGALPAPVDIIQNLSVGASLGQDSIRQGMTAGALGAAMVVLFMLAYYRVSGLIANVAMVLNILFLFVGLAMLGSTLTLPGIAGIVLTIGMAVDANVIIYERMREEFALGKSVKSGVDSGFDKAFWTIIDSQVTTLITALVLFLFGTGPIKGFAVTLSLGIMANLFAVLFCSRLAYDVLLARRSLSDLRFMRFLGATRIDFMRIKRIPLTISALLVALGLMATVQIMRGHANLGVDFTGGSLFLFKAGQNFTLDDVRPVLRDNGFEGADLQRVVGEERLMVKIKKSEAVVREQGEAVAAVLRQHLPDKGFVLESQSEIGSSISAMLRNTAFKAIALSLLGIVGYLALRFDLRFGVAATAATFHDVLVVLGICWLLDVEITLLIITALLTLAGYSLNDTVVIFDRIREIRQKQGEKDMDLVINLSVNQTLSRSIITVLTVFLTTVSLYFFGGAVIHDFAFALLIGLIVGSYSSIFIASPLLTLWPRREAAK